MITTKLFGKSNAILITDEGEFVAVIGCSGGDGFNITHKIEKAIKEHFVADTVEIEQGRTLTNQEEVLFDAKTIEDGEESIRSFTLKIVTTY